MRGPRGSTGPASRWHARAAGLPLAAVAAVAAAFAVIASTSLTQGELVLDEASTFLIAARPLADVWRLPTSFHSQPPLFYLALHEWLRFGDSEAWLRLLPVLFMAAAALTLLLAASIPPFTRAISAAMLLLTSYGGGLAVYVRPYSMATWFSAWSCLQFCSLLRSPSRRQAAWYVAATALMEYSLAMTIWVVFAQGLCVGVSTALDARREGVSAALARRRTLILAYAAAVVIYVPYVWSAWRLQGAMGTPSLGASVAAAFNPRHYVSGPLYLLAMPGGLGYVALAAAVCAVWFGYRRRDGNVAVLATIVLAQIALTHGFLAGRSEFAFRYLAPAYPALCLLAGGGIDGWLSWIPRGRSVMTAGLLVVSIAAIAIDVRTPHVEAAGPLRQVEADFVRLAGQKFIFFDVGWEGQRMVYEARHDPDVHVMLDDGEGWAAGGRMMTAPYVNRIVDREAREGTLFFYQVDAVWRADVFDGAFVPAMARHGCVRVYERVVPTYTRPVPGDAGAVLYGYACHAG